MARLVRCGWLPILLLVGATIIGCNNTPAPAPQPKPPEVQVSLPVTRRVTDNEEFTGYTDAIKTIVIRARVSGYLKSAPGNPLPLKEGDVVQKGTLLYEIDPVQYQAELNRAKANLVESQAQLKHTEADYKRGLSLLSSKSISQEEFDKMVGDRDVAAGSVGVARANLILAQQNLDWTRVTAPITGRLSRNLIDPGNLVKADDTPLTSIVSLDPIYAYFDVDEDTVLRMLSLIQQGKIKSYREQEVPVTLQLKNGQDYPYPGTLNFVDNKLDTGTGTRRLRAVFPNPHHFLSPGLFARVRLPIGGPHQAILIPEQAIGADQEQQFVYVVDDQNKVSYRKVKTGRLHDGLRVVTEGLKPGEKVVVSGLQRVRPGGQVTPKPWSPKK